MICICFYFFYVQFVVCSSHILDLIVNLFYPWILCKILFNVFLFQLVYIVMSFLYFLHFNYFYIFVCL